MIGRIIHDVMADSLSGVQDRSCQTDFLGSTIQLITAIKAYKKEKGDYTDYMEKIVPIYITEVTKDRLEGKKFRYKKQKKIIYTVGKEMEDRGRREGDDREKMKEKKIKIKKI